MERVVVTCTLNQSDGIKKTEYSNIDIRLFSGMRMKSGSLFFKACLWLQERVSYC